MIFSLKQELLRIINEKDSFDTLLNNQVTYSQIALLLLEYELEGIIKNFPEGYRLTEKGFMILNEKKSFEKIQPLEKYRIKTCVELDQVYIPNYIEGVIKELKN